MKTCKVCKNNFDEDFYENHESNCTNLFHQTIKCLCCKKTFNSIYEDNFRQHAVECEKNFLDGMEYEARKLEEGDVHSGTAVHCFKCNEIVLKKDIKDHYYRVCQKTTKKVTFSGTCFLCKEELPIDQISVHVENCKKNSDKYVQCDICDKHIYKTSIYKHYKFVHKMKYARKATEKKPKDDNGKIKCPRCDLKFLRTNLYAHMKNVHKEKYVEPPKKTKTKNKKCPKCKKKLVNLAEHLRAVHNIKPKPENAGKKKGNLFFITVQQPIKHYMMQMLKKRNNIFIRHYRYERIHAHLEHVVRSTKSTYYYRGKLIHNYPVYSGRYQFLKYYTNTPPEDRRSRFKLPPRTVIKEAVVGNDWGVLENHGHCHMYLKFHKKVYIHDLQTYVRKRCRFLGSIEPGRNAEKQIKYCSKEDLKALAFNVDNELMHDRWQMGQIAYRALDFRDGITQMCYQSTKWKTEFKLKQFKKIFDSIRTKKYLIWRTKL